MSEEKAKTTGDDEIREVVRLLDAMDRADDAGLYIRVRITIRTRNLKRRMRRMLRTASIIMMPIMLAAGIWIYMEHDTGSDLLNVPISQYIAVPKIITPDGKELIFDDSVTSHIVDDGEVTIEKNNGSLVMHRKGTGGTDYHFYRAEVPKGAKLDLILEDGTHVWLNSDSRLRYPSVFAQGERRVTLEGEAYFEVAADPEKPFVVDVAGQELTVLGTEFNISAYADDNVVYTTLMGGLISLKTTITGNALTLQPGHQAQLDLASGTFGKKVVDMDDILAWKNDVIVFNDLNLGQIMKKLARIYDMEYEFRDKYVKSLFARGTMPVQDDITVILRLIEASGHVKFEIEGDLVIIKAAESVF